MAPTEDLKAVYKQCCEQMGCRVNSGILSRIPIDSHGFTEFDLTDNFVGIVGIIPVLAVVKKASELRYLGLSGNGLDNSSVDALVTALDIHPSIQSIDLSHNRISETGGQRLKEFVSTHPTIYALNLDKTLVSPALMRSIAKLIAVNLDNRSHADSKRALLLGFPNANRKYRNRAMSLPVSRIENAALLFEQQDEDEAAEEAGGSPSKLEHRPSSAGTKSPKVKSPIKSPMSGGAGGRDRATSLPPMKLQGPIQTVLNAQQPQRQPEQNATLKSSQLPTAPQYATPIAPAPSANPKASVFAPLMGEPPPESTPSSSMLRVRDWNVFRCLVFPIELLMAVKRVFWCADEAQVGEIPIRALISGKNHHVLYLPELAHPELTETNFHTMLKQVDPRHDDRCDFWEFLSFVLFTVLDLHSRNFDVLEFVLFVTETFRGIRGGCVIRDTVARSIDQVFGKDIYLSGHLSTDWEYFRTVQWPVGRLVYAKLLWQRLDPTNQGFIVVPTFIAWRQSARTAHAYHTAPVLTSILQMAFPANLNPTISFWTFLALEMYHDLDLHKSINLHEWIRFYNDHYGSNECVHRPSASAEESGDLAATAMGTEMKARQVLFMAEMAIDFKPAMNDLTLIPQVAAPMVMAERNAKLSHLVHGEGSAGGGVDAFVAREQQRMKFFAHSAMDNPHKQQPLIGANVVHEIVMPLGLLVHFKQCFQRANKSKTGVLNVSELGEWAQSVGLKHVRYETLKRMVQQVDLGNKGGVDFFEFLGVQIYQNYNLAERQVEVKDFVQAVARTQYIDGVNAQYT